MDKTILQIATAIPVRCRHGHTRALLAQAKTTAMRYVLFSRRKEPELWKRGLICLLNLGLIARLPPVVVA